MRKEWVIRGKLNKSLVAHTRLKYLKNKLMSIIVWKYTGLRIGIIVEFPIASHFQFILIL